MGNLLQKYLVRIMSAELQNLTLHHYRYGETYMVALVKRFVQITLSSLSNPCREDKALCIGWDTI